MKHNVRINFPIILFVFLCLFFPYKAYAYLDPGSGSYILQLVLAGFLGAGFMIKTYWKKIKAFVLGFFSKTKDDKKDIK